MIENAKIMVVDDEEVMREFLLEVFASHGPIGAKNGEEALELMAQNPVSLIITDLKMPKMDGLELLRKAKQMNEKVKVIVVTGYASLDTASDCIKEGAADFLKKPFSILQIREAVRRALEEL